MSEFINLVTKRLLILSDLYVHYRTEDEFKEFAKGNEVGLSLAHLYAVGLAEIKADGNDRLSETYDLLVKAMGLDPDVDYKNIEDMILSKYGTVARPSNDFIDNLHRDAGVSEELLTSAMDKLVRVTEDVDKAQELFNLSLAISAATGKSLEKTSRALALGFMGQNQALDRLGIGLTEAELQTKSREEIFEKLASLFAGQSREGKTHA